LLTRLLKKQGVAPKRMITGKLRSYAAARRKVMPGVEHRSHKGLNNRAESSHVPFRKRERMRQGFRSVGSLQHFVSLFSAIRNHFVLSRTKRSAIQIRNHRLNTMAEWNAVALQIA
jgi:putative transposase